MEVIKATTRFKLSEFAPKDAEWGHTGYVTVDLQEKLIIDGRTIFAMFFTPRKGTTFEQIEDLARRMDDLLDTVYINH